MTGSAEGARSLWRSLIAAVGALLIWRALVAVEAAPPYLLPAPENVLLRLYTSRMLLAEHAASTFGVAILGLLLGTTLGAAAAVLLARFDAARRWLLPLMIAGQAAPVFAIAPLLTLWLGFGVAAKLVMTILVVYFPVATSFYDGLARAPRPSRDMARVMGASAWSELWILRTPAALPALGTGVRMSAAFAPIAAVVGEWTGGAQGLGYLMLYANARTDATLLFAALLLLGLLGVALYGATRALTRRAAPWAEETVF